VEDDDRVIQNVAIRFKTVRRVDAEHAEALVSRFRSSQALAATSDANFGIEGTLATL
jgi:hypothetical protein